MCVSVGIIVGARGFRRWEGMGSRGHVVEGEEEISNNTSSKVRENGRRMSRGRWAIDDRHMDRERREDLDSESLKGGKSKREEYEGYGRRR
ncbi:hypothetical protein FKM82_022176 [Ascaphus truei]